MIRALPKSRQNCQVVEAKAGKGSATLSMAYSGARFGNKAGDIFSRRSWAVTSCTRYDCVAPAVVASHLAQWPFALWQDPFSAISWSLVCSNFLAITLTFLCVIL